MPPLKNPFTVTKAVDFSDEQIAQYWVDPSRDGGIEALLDPRERMPVILLGSKGSGRTHLLRYHSYPLQKLRAGSTPLWQVIKRDGYVGLFSRCQGLSAGRFNGRCATREEWASLFIYYFDLYLAELTLRSFAEILATLPDDGVTQAALVADISQLFDSGDVPPMTQLSEMTGYCRSLRREIDLVANNAVFARRLDAPLIRATRGQLVFGIPQAVSRHVPALADVRTLYILDELESLDEQQQRYIQTLIREREDPTGFWVSSRVHGLRTYATFSAGESNVQGAEFHPLHLDEKYRAHFQPFACRLVARRLLDAGYRLDRDTTLALHDVRSPEETTDAQLAQQLTRYFEARDTAGLALDATRYVFDLFPNPRNRRWLVVLGRKLAVAWRRDQAPGIESSAAVQQVIDQVAYPDVPLLERLNVFMLYRAWAKRKPLVEAATRIRTGMLEYCATPRAESEHGRLLGHFRIDLLAQMARESRQGTGALYLGFDTLVDMSAGNPRHLLTLLRHVFHWSVFYGERPFSGGTIGVRAQNAGITEASNWFYENAKNVGSDAERLRQVIDRLGLFFRTLRFADKPVESSLIAFSLETASAEVTRTLKDAEDNALLIRIPRGHKDRNTGAVRDKLYLNPLLSPRYTLPIAVRGCIELRPSELEAIFGAGSFEQFASVLEARVRRMNAPFLESDEEHEDPAQISALSPQQDLFS